jgi:hypothetical protein
VVCNTSAAEVTYRVAVRPAGATLATAHYVAYDATLLVDLSVGPLTSGEAEDLAREALQLYTDGLAPGADVAGADVVSVLRDAVPGLVNVSGLEINASLAGFLVIDFNEVASYNDGSTNFTITPA